MSRTARQAPRSGLLCVVGRTVADERILDVSLAAPWRGPVREILRPARDVAIGVCGDAHLSVRGSRAVAIHGRVDAVGGRPVADLEEAAEILIAEGDAAPAGGVDGDAVVLIALGGDVHVLRSAFPTRPLFGMWTDRGVAAVASEVVQVPRLLGLHPPPDPVTLAVYRADGYPPAEATFIAGVKALPCDVRTSLRRGATVTRARADGDGSGCGGPAAFRDALDASVRRRVDGSLNPAAELSGGMDSTSVLASLCTLILPGAARPTAHTVAFPAFPVMDETVYAEAVARFLDVVLHTVPVGPDDVAVWARRVPHHGPTHPTCVVEWETLGSAAEAGADLVLTGHCGDWLGDPLLSEVEDCLIGRHWGHAARWMARGLLADPHRLVRRLGRYVVRGEWRRAPLRIGDALRADWWVRTTCEVTERMGAMLGLRVEHPFMDDEVIRVAELTPPGARWHPRRTKHLMRLAAADRLPRLVTARPDKTFFDPLVEATESRTGSVLDMYASAWVASYTGGQGTATGTSGIPTQGGGSPPDGRGSPPDVPLRREVRDE